jgi:hypothetical protein
MTGLIPVCGVIYFLKNTKCVRRYKKGGNFISKSSLELQKEREHNWERGGAAVHVLIRDGFPC